MTRQEFLKACGLLGIGLSTAPSLLTSCAKEVLPPVNFTGKVLIIGAGSAGLIAGYHLNKLGINFEILEASSTYGGRVKKTKNFADFPIDLGAEWVHDTPNVFFELMGDTSIDGSIDLIPYNPETIYQWNKGTLSKQNWESPFYGEHKFSNTTWHDFFEDYIVPQIEDRINYDSPVVEIDYRDNLIQVRRENDEVFTADKVLVTVPTTILKSEMINFIPALPQEKITALDRMYMPDGIKVFIEFSERFYPDMVTTTEGTDPSDEKLFYDAGFKKDTDKNIFALFNVGPSAGKYTELENDQAIIDAVLKELDEMFEGKATQFYKKHIIQNWSKEPFIQGSYTYSTSDQTANMDQVSAAIDQKIYFAGEALSEYASATVHGAGLSGSSVANTMIRETAA